MDTITRVIELPNEEIKGIIPYMIKQINEFWNESYASGFDYKIIKQDLVDKIIQINRGSKTFLDLGCGTGDFMRKMEEKNFETTGFEISEEAIKIAKEKGTKGEILLQNLDEIENFKIDKKFDIIATKQVFAFIKNRANFLNWVKEHLSINGIFILNTPVSTYEKPFEKPGIDIKKSEVENLLKLAFTEVDLIDEDLSPLGFFNTYICK